MPRPRISYPITTEVLDALHSYPNIANAIAPIASELRSELEIVRVLGNLHCNYLKQLAALIENSLPATGSIGKRLLITKDNLDFSQALGEFSLFAKLRERFGARASAVELGPAEKGHDIDVALGDHKIKIEVYTPTDFFGYQLFERYVDMILKYLDVSSGFALECELVNGTGNPFFAYMFEDKEAEVWLNGFAEDVLEWFSTAQAGSVYRRHIGLDNSELLVTLRELHEDKANRSVGIHFPTKSTDTRLFFEVGDATDTACGQWGKKLKNKIAKKQCGEPSVSVARVLVVNFALADTGWPEFLTWPSFTARFDATIRLLVGRDQPYDAILPVRLGGIEHFGEPCVINSLQADAVAKFAQEAGLR
jgi:hypothetical protein